MKYSGLFLFSIIIFFIGCDNAREITNKDYKYEKIAFERHCFTFNFHLENIGASGKLHNLVNKLIYDNRNFDEYAKHMEESFIGNIDEADYPPVVNEDGTEYVYQSDLIEEYSVVFNNSAYIIIYYNSYAYYSGNAHGRSLAKYFIIDVNEKRILNVDDLISPIPDDLLKEIIEAYYNITDFLRENIWPADTVNFSSGNIELMWNTYTITPHAAGIISIEIQGEKIEQYLTDKGKTLIKITSGEK